MGIDIVEARKIFEILRIKNTVTYVKAADIGFNLISELETIRKENEQQKAEIERLRKFKDSVMASYTEACNRPKITISEILEWIEQALKELEEHDEQR